MAHVRRVAGQPGILINRPHQGLQGYAGTFEAQLVPSQHSSLDPGRCSNVLLDQPRTLGLSRQQMHRDSQRAWLQSIGSQLHIEQCRFVHCRLAALLILLPTLRDLPAAEAPLAALEALTWTLKSTMHMLALCLQDLAVDMHISEAHKQSCILAWFQLVAYSLIEPQVAAPLGHTAHILEKR